MVFVTFIAMNYKVSFVFKVGNWKIALQHHYIALIKIIKTLYQKHKYESMKIIINHNHKEMILASTTKKLQQCSSSLQRCDSNILISNYPFKTSLRIHRSNPRGSFIPLALLPETFTTTCNTGESAFCNP